MINDRNVRPFFLHRFLNNSLRIVLETCVYRSSATSIFPLSQFDDLQARALTMKRSRQVPPSFLFSLICVEIVISSCTVCSVFFTLWLTIRRTLPSAVAEYATFRDLLSRKKKKEPVLCEKSCDGGPLVVAQRKIFSPFKPPSTIATVNIRKHPVSMYGAELFYPDDYNALLFYSTPEMNCARCTQ